MRRHTSRQPRRRLVLDLRNHDREVLQGKLMNEQTDIDTYTRIDYYIALLDSEHKLTTRERRDLALLLRRWRKQQYGSALTHTEQKEGRSETNP